MKKYNRPMVPIAIPYSLTERARFFLRPETSPQVVAAERSAYRINNAYTSPPLKSQKDPWPPAILYNLTERARFFLRPEASPP